MPHFAVDETAHAHRKVLRAGNAAVGLWVRLGSYACDQLTDGVIPAEIAASYGTPPTLRKLVAVGMLHPAGHECPRCAQPEQGDYVIHDYLVSNSSKAQVADRRVREKEKKKQQRSAAASRSETRRTGDETAGKRDGNSDENTANGPSIFGISAVQGAVSPGDKIGTRARARPIPPPSPLASPTEKQEDKQAGAGAGPRIPEFARPLLALLAGEGLIVGWALSEAEWFILHAHILRSSPEAMAEFVRRRWNAEAPPKTARYLLRMWQDMPDVPAEAPVAPAADGTVVPFPGSAHRTQPEDLFDRALARARSRAPREEET